MISLLTEGNQHSGASEKLISDSVKQILGKPGKTIDDFAKTYMGAFK